MANKSFSERLRLDGACAIVTGASTRPGIGHSLALLMAERGAQQIVVVDINAAGAREAGADIEALGCACSVVVVDVGDAAAVREELQQVIKNVGAVDILANCAGNVTASSFLELDTSEMRSALDSHLKGTITCCEAIVPHMLENDGGRIVNIASIAGKRGGGWIGKAAYSAAKAGVQGFTKALAKEVVSSGVRVNAVNPGLTDTGRVNSLKADAELWRTVSSSVPMKRAGTPGEIAAAMGFLVSDAASYLQGETINIDGGLMLE